MVVRDRDEDAARKPCYARQRVCHAPRTHAHNWAQRYVEKAFLVALWRAWMCPTPQWALRKLADFEKAGYTAIAVTGLGGTTLTKADLDALVASETATAGGGPVSINAPSAPELVA